MAEPAALDLSGFGLERISYIGKGHFATVQLVREIDTGQTFVAKCVRLGQLSERDQKLANQEVFLLEALNHPLIVAYHDSFLLEGQDILVILMEHCEGGDLRHAIAEKAERGQNFSEEQVMTWFAQIALALQYIHQEKVLHRDLKCSNIFLVGGSLLKLGDFGISRVFESSADAAQTLVGTPYYMSPEVCSSRPYSYKSDVWSLGCVLYELCMLKHAFEHSTLQGLIHRIKSGVYEPIPPMYSQELNEFIRSLLTISADARPSVNEVCAHPLLRRYVEKQELPEQPPLDQESREKSKSERRRKSLTHARSKDFGFSPQDTPNDMPALEPQDMSLAIACRAQRYLTDRQQTAQSAVAPFADTQVSGGGIALSPDALRGALLALKLGLSKVEVSILEAALERMDRKITPNVLEAKLAEGSSSLKIQQIHSWARQALRAPASRILGAMEGRDVQRTGILPTSEFQAGLLEIARLSSEENCLMVILADKAESGDVEYASFAQRFGIGGAMEDTAFFTCAAEDIQAAAACREAWC